MFSDDESITEAIERTLQAILASRFSGSHPKTILLWYNQAMNSVAMDFETSLLSRLVDPENPNLKPEAAEGILALEFPQSDLDRMKELAEKARAGTLASDEKTQADSYERVGSFLALIQSKARISLKKSSHHDGQSEPS